MVYRHGIIYSLIKTLDSVSIIIGSLNSIFDELPYSIVGEELIFLLSAESMLDYLKLFEFLFLTYDRMLIYLLFYPWS